ncbi:MAG: NifU family protein [Bacilli bacterium]|nr:NifU family protein [Bacilli bacterium]
MTKEEIELKIISVIDRIKPFIISDGGNIDFVKYEDNIVYVRLDGACKDCTFIDVTIKEGIEEILISEIPEIKEVKNIDE